LVVFGRPVKCDAYHTPVCVAEVDWKYYHAGGVEMDWWYDLRLL
jgi:hypothetical protein